MLSCVFIRHFAAAVERRHQPELHPQPLLIVTGERVRRIVATSARPRQLGVLPQMSLKQAQLICPEAVVIPANKEAYRHAADQIATELLYFANKVECEYQPTGCAFYLATDTETELIQQMVEQRLNASAGLGIAANKLSARVAAAIAVHDRSCIRVDTGGEAAFLAPYPVSLLPLSKDMARRLPLLGIDTLGQYAALPRAAVWEQFGQHGKWLHDLANGSDLRSIRPFVPPRKLGARHSFDDPVADRQMLTAVLHRMAVQFSEQLCGEAAGRIMLRLVQTDGRTLESYIQPHQPVRDLITLARRLDALLQQQSFTASVTELEVELLDLHTPQPRQLSLFDEMRHQQRLQPLLPGWIMRHPQTAFYTASVAGVIPYALPEDQSSLQEIRGA